jgi:hypothetical protein
MLSPTRVIGHKEWAASRKSDPTYDMNWRRARVAAFTPQGEDDMPLSEDDLNRLADRVWTRTPPGTGNVWPIHRSVGTDDKTGTILVLSRQIVADLGALSRQVAELVNRPAADVDVAELVGQLAPHLAGLATSLSDEDLARVARAVNDERDRRQRDDDPATGPAS